MSKDRIRKAVRRGYANIVYKERSCCAPVSPCCDTLIRIEEISKRVGYTDEDLKSVPKGANLGLGCGNPIALASLRAGETVLDLGSGAGFDCFLAARKVGKSGQVIGVDMTPEMVDKARENARKGSYENVEFRLGEIENIPAADTSVDVVISNCVINLSPEKERVFKEAYRVLKPGGRLMVSDIVLVKELPGVIKNSIDAYIGCLAGAIMKDEYIETIRAAGFHDIRILDEAQFPSACIANDPTAQVLIERMKLPQDKLAEIGTSVLSIKVSAKKPG
ncbi:MAG: methyltransferase domain-containing protein [Methanophagales archaeon ANME-1-THS]|nr:MAG: methyltransferase domain-containing protein [Methanophagales archaeon ANME-1-THS]